ncbi:class I adenylate-forming enzyme family protein [Microbacterium sp. No. 7]|uniref:class I adenylate-forming enzyme family protein n=1 Tax=Microbacterium sp. No. 7 TaxID=1714373 RepID=UPI0006D1DDEA|nr:class I adenylate-forming enzyme family protein [Microbacterium sp. No. 7]ALJ18860.1 hypothetical protein AOA12_02610 [Microbacterium sp. No. 7]
MRMRDRLSSLLEHAPRDAEAVCVGAEAWWTWRDLHRVASDAVARADAAGLGPGARVGVALHNRPAYVAIVLGLLATGRVITTLNPMQPAERLAADVRRSALPIVFGGEGVFGADEVSEAVTESGLLVTVGDDGTLSGGGEARPWPEHAFTWPEHAFNPGVAVEILTSGTTGPPKRVSLRDVQFDTSMAAQARGVDGDPTQPRLSSGVSIVTAPLVHIGGLWAALNTLYAGRRLVLLEKFRVPDWVAAVRTHRPRIASVVPAALRSILEADVDPADLSSLDAVTSGTAPCPPELSDAFRDRFGVPVLTTYGATEFAGAIAAWTLSDYRQWGEGKRGSVGRAFPGVSVRAFDPESGEALPPGELGTLQVRTAQLGHDEWTTTSDLGRVDEDGFVFVTGRADDAIIRGGFKVHRGSIQKALEAHPEVAVAAVIPRDDERLGAVPVAAVELVPGSRLTVADLEAHARATLIPYEVPAEFLIVDEMPRTPALKVSLVDVRALFDGTAST